MVRARLPRHPPRPPRARTLKFHPGDSARPSIHLRRSSLHANRRTDPRRLLAPRFRLPNRQLKSRKGKLVGEDEFGNKYFENTSYQSGRHRWVEYADLDNYNASTVPSEWHGWLSHVDDEPGLATRTAPKYQAKFIAGGLTTGVQGEMYQPKGSFYNKRGMRNWKRYTPWSPP